MSESKKTLWIVVAGVGALVGAALLYHYATAADEDSTKITEEDIKRNLEAEKIGEPVRTKNGLLESRYFLNLLQFIGV